MSSPSLPHIVGSVPPIPTPLLDNSRCDAEAFARIAAHLETGGIDAAFVLGSTGELASLSHTCRREAIEASASAFTVPLLVGIGDNCLEESLALADAAANAGATAVVLNAPSYFEISAREMRAYLDRILPVLPLPVFLYNMPWLTGHRFDRETIAHAIQFPNLIGFKDSSGDLDYLRLLVEEAAVRPELTVLTGSEFQYLEALRLGAHGVVGGGANMYPALFQQLRAAHHAGESATAAALQRQISELGNSIFGLTGNPSSVFPCIKGGLAALGLCSPCMAPPLESCSPEVVAGIAALIRQPVPA